MKIKFKKEVNRIRQVVEMEGWQISHTLEFLKKENKMIEWN